MRQPATHPLADDPRTVWIARWFSRSLPYGADVLAENVLDPSHVGFSHHGILGNRNTVRPPAPIASVMAPTSQLLLAFQVLTHLASLCQHTLPLWWSHLASLCQHTLLLRWSELWSYCSHGRSAWRGRMTSLIRGAGRCRCTEQPQRRSP